jgi:hypothetical protein
MATRTGEILQAFALGVEQSETWQFLGASGDCKENFFDASVISRGAIPVIKPLDFGDIGEAIRIAEEPGEAKAKIRIVCFSGDLFGLEDFTRAIVDRVIYPVETMTDPLATFNGPTHILGAVIDKALGT